MARLAALPPLLVVAALVAMPDVAQAAPRFFVNGALLSPNKEHCSSTKPSCGLALGQIELKNAGLEITCESVAATKWWNEGASGSERGFEETVGYATWECKDTRERCEVVNERGVRKEDTFLTAEGPPEAKTEKAHKTGITSLPWTGELTEKEGGKFLQTQHVKLWLVVPLGSELGGSSTGGKECPLGGNEIPFEDQEGPTEKAAGDELEPRWVNGVKDGLSPSKLVFGGEKTEKSGAPETGRLESPFGPAFITGTLLAGGSTTFELVQVR